MFEKRRRAIFKGRQKVPQYFGNQYGTTQSSAAIITSFQKTVESDQNCFKKKKKGKFVSAKLVLLIDIFNSHILQIKQ